MKKKEVFIVIPTIRDLDFLKCWGNEFKNCIGVIVEDSTKKEVKIPKSCFKETFHYSWKEIDKELGKDSWIISRKNSGIRCFGFLKAYQMGADIIITLDDDCYPEGKNFVKTHVDNLSLKAPDRWFSTFPHPAYNFTRGFPYGVRDKYSVVLSHGIWSGGLDLDAKTELKIGRPMLSCYNFPLRLYVPYGYYFPMCVMNLAFTREIIPLMYMPLMGENDRGEKWGYDRFDDIWSGILIKKILDHLNLRVVIGSPFVKHKKKSDIKESLIKEEAGIEMNEDFWKLVDRVELKEKKIKEAYQELIEKVEWPQTTYFRNFENSIKLWLQQF